MCYTDTLSQKNLINNVTHLWFPASVCVCKHVRVLESSCITKPCADASHRVHCWACVCVCVCELPGEYRRVYDISPPVRERKDGVICLVVIVVYILKYTHEIRALCECMF